MSSTFYFHFWSFLLSCHFPPRLFFRLLTRSPSETLSVLIWPTSFRVFFSTPFLLLFSRQDSESTSLLLSISLFFFSRGLSIEELAPVALFPSSAVFLAFFMDFLTPRLSRSWFSYSEGDKVPVLPVKETEVVEFHQRVVVLFRDGDLRLLFSPFCPLFSVSPPLEKESRFFGDIDLPSHLSPVPEICVGLSPLLNLSVNSE